MSVEHIRSILRQAVRHKVKTPLNILTVGVTHERYEENLCKTNHNFYVFNPPGMKEWDKRYSNIPTNYHITDHIPDYIDYDLVLCQVSDKRMKMAVELSQMFNIPLIRHTHTVPTSQAEIEYHQQFRGVAKCNTFISEYSKQAWGYEDGIAIKHGLDLDFWWKEDDLEVVEEKALSVVNLWEQRDWACGWKLWNEGVRPYIPTTVAGDNPGLSEAKSPDQLRDLYHSHLIFVNTSLNSPIPMSLLEAMACGCCVISLPTCMIPEIIENGRNGILCETPEEIVRACKFCFENHDFALNIGMKAAKTIEEDYNINKFVSNWNTVFRGVL
jgi:hypothetical protein